MEQIRYRQNVRAQLWIGDVHVGTINVDVDPDEGTAIPIRDHRVDHVDDETLFYSFVWNEDEHPRVEVPARA